MLKWFALTTLSLLVACGDANFATPTQARGKASQQSDTQNASRKAASEGEGEQPSHAQPCCGPQLPVGPKDENEGNTGLLQPVPVVGSYLAALVTDASGTALGNAEVVLQETDMPDVSATSDRAGLVNIRISDPNKVQRILVRRRIGASITESSLSLSDLDRGRVSRATYPNSEATRLATTLLEMRATANGSTLSLATITNPASDTKPPQLGSINTSPGGSGKVVTVNASDAESGLHPQAYSFDGGATWGSSNQYTGAVGTTLSSGQIQVRDRAGNISQFRSTLVL